MFEIIKKDGRVDQQSYFFLKTIRRTKNINLQLQCKYQISCTSPCPLSNLEKKGTFKKKNTQYFFTFYPKNRFVHIIHVFAMFYRIEKEPLVSYESKIKKYLTILPFFKRLRMNFAPF